MHKSCRTSFYKPYPLQFQPLKMSQIDFNKVLQIINQQTSQQFLQTRKKNIFYETQRQFKFKQNHHCNVNKKTNIHVHSRSGSRQMQRLEMKFYNQCLTSDFSRAEILKLNKNFIQNQNIFRASFAIRRDANKIRGKEKQKVQKEKEKINYYIVKNDNNIKNKLKISSEFQTYKSVKLLSTSASSTSNPQKLISRYKLKVHSQQTENYKYFKIEQIMNKHNRIRKILFRQIPHQNKKFHYQQKQNFYQNYNRKQQNLWDSKQSCLQSVEKYLELKVKNVNLQERERMSSNDVKRAKRIVMKQEKEKTIKC